MTITISKQVLVSELLKAFRVIPKKTDLPILQTFLFQVEGDRLTLTASSQEARFSTHVSCRSDGDFEMCLPYSVTDALKSVPEQPVSIEREGTVIRISYNGGMFEVPDSNPQAYPTPKQDTSETSVLDIPESLLSDGIQSVVNLTDTDPTTRPFTNSVQMEVRDGKMTFVATDSHMLGFVSYSYPDTEDVSVMISRNNAMFLKNALGSSGDPVRVSIGERWTEMHVRNWSFTMRNVEGKYPNWRSILPRGEQMAVRVDASVMDGMTERMSCFANKAFGLVTIELQGDTLSMSAKDMDMSTSAQESCQVEPDGTPVRFKTGFKASFLRTVLQCAGGGKVEFRMSDPMKATLILPTELPEGTEKTFLIMPVSVNP